MKPEHLLELGFLAIASWSLVDPDDKKRAQLYLLKRLERGAMRVAQVSADIAASAEMTYKERLVV